MQTCTQTHPHPHLNIKKAEKMTAAAALAAKSSDTYFEAGMLAQTHIHTHAGVKCETFFAIQEKWLSAGSIHKLVSVCE